MSQKHEAYISVWEDSSWRGTSLGNPIPLYVDSESLNINKNIRDLQRLTRDGRVPKVESQVGAELTPAGKITYQPRTDDCAAILFSHFQTGSIQGETGSFKYTFFPSKSNPTYTNNTVRSLGTYGGDPGDVYSVSFVKKYLDTDENGGTNSILFHHGICDSIDFDLSVNSDFIMGCDFKFRDVVVGTALPGNPPDAGYGRYSSNDPWKWFEGTVLVEGTALELQSIKWSCNNNITQKSVAGRQNPDWFSFGDYVTEGVFELDFPRDGMLQFGSMLGTKEFSIVGTLFRSGTEEVSFDMPHCVRKPFDVRLSGRTVTAGIPFRAFEKDGTSPITMTVMSGVALTFGTDFFWDGGTTFFGAGRTLGDYGIVDGGTTFYSSSRTLGDYTLADRDLT